MPGAMLTEREISLISLPRLEFLALIPKSHTCPGLPETNVTPLLLALVTLIIAPLLFYTDDTRIYTIKRHRMNNNVLSNKEGGPQSYTQEAKSQSVDSFCCQHLYLGLVEYVEFVFVRINLLFCFSVLLSDCTPRYFIRG